MRNYAAGMRRVVATLLLGWLLAVGPAAAAADQLCVDEDGQRIPGCTVEEPDFGTATDTGVPGSFVALMVLGGLVAVGVTVYKVSMARGMARESGMDPDRATAMTLLEDDGLEATYLASSLRPQTRTADSAPPPRTVTERLAELEALLAAGTVSQAEYDERRTAILGSL